MQMLSTTGSLVPQQQVPPPPPLTRPDYDAELTGTNSSILRQNLPTPPPSVFFQGALRVHAQTACLVGGSARSRGFIMSQSWAWLRCAGSSGGPGSELLVLLMRGRSGAASSARRGFCGAPLAICASCKHHREFASWSFIWGPGDCFLGEAKQRNCTLARNKKHTGDGPFNQPIVAGVFPKRDVGNLNLSSSCLSMTRNLRSHASFLGVRTHPVYSHASREGGGAAFSPSAATL